jgi:hypothetical protein
MWQKYAELTDNFFADITISDLVKNAGAADYVI